MRYLYGDLTEARCQEDTLALLQRVVATTVDALKLHRQMDDALLAVQQEKNRLVQAVEDIDGFRVGLEQAIQDRVAGRHERDVVAQMAAAVSNTLVQHAQESKARMQASVEENLRGSQMRIDSLAHAAFDVMRSFFMSSGLPVEESKLRCTLSGPRYEAESEVLDMTGILCVYGLDTSSSGFFDQPRRFGDLVPGRHEIPVGTRKKRLKKDPVRETVRIDDAMLAQVQDSGPIGEYRITPRLGSGMEALLVRLKKEPNDALMVFKLDVQGEQILLPNELFAAEHIELLMRAWQQIEPHIESLYQQRETLNAVSIEGRDVLQGRLFTEVVHRLVGYLGPVVREIDAHSNAPGELSLRVEQDEEGKREEFFLRKSKLTERIQELPPAHQKLFDPLGLGANPPIREVPGGRVEIQDPALRNQVQVSNAPAPSSPPGPAPERDKQ